MPRLTRFVTPSLATILLAAVPTAVATAATPQELWEAWPEARFVDTPAPCLRHQELVTELARLEARHPDGLRVEEIGRSVQGRSIHLMTLGHGPRKVLLWSQMHGDEPSATPALLDIAHVLLDAPDREPAATILEELTLLAIPMLNPDGAERYRRRNALAIDVNRDALDLATPEGRILKRIRDEHEPILGFNLHDQDRRTTVGDTGVLATNAVLAVAGDPEGTVTPGRLRAKRACTAIVEALAPFMPGGMARYDEDWNPRAFGDNITAWGTPVVLVESGGLPAGHPFTDLTRLDFVALLRVLEDLAADDLAGHEPTVYDRLPRTEDDEWTDVALRGGEIRQPGSSTSYRADLAFDLLRDDREVAGCAAGETIPRSRIVEVGDARFLAAGRDIDLSGRLILAPFVVGVDGWETRRWLDADALDRLAALGVARITWAVPPSRLATAARRVESLAAAGRPVIEVSTLPAELPPAVLTAPPEPPASPQLSDVAAALLSADLGRDLSPEHRVALLWGADPDRMDHRWPPLRPRQPASFLVVAPNTDSTPDPGRSRLLSVWIDGVELEPAASSPTERE